MRQFCNNLRENDRVFDTVSKRQGKVARTPKNEKNRMTCIVFDGTGTGRYVDVMQLRLMPDGRTPEDVPPVDGEPPDLPEAEIVQVPREAVPRVLDVLRNEQAKLNKELNDMNERAREIRAELDRLEKAIAVMDGKGA